MRTPIDTWAVPAAIFVFAGCASADICDEYPHLCEGGGGSLVPIGGGAAGGDGGMGSEGGAAGEGGLGGGATCTPETVTADCGLDSECVTFACVDGACEATNAQDGMSCDDGLFCNGTDGCNGGACISSGDPCSVNVGDADADCHESCNETNDNCTADDPSGAACSDGLFCTAIDTCNGTGICVGVDDPCIGGTVCADSCNETDNDCFESNGTPCGSSVDSFCTDPDICDGSGNCLTYDVTDGTACGDPTDDACTNPDTCNAGACALNHEFGGTPCSDGLFCNGIESCGGGTCGGSTGNPCPGQDVAIADAPQSCEDSCNESADLCNAADANGTTCNEDNDGTNGACNGTLSSPNCIGD